MKRFLFTLILLISGFLAAAYFLPRHLDSRFNRVRLRAPAAVSEEARALHDQLQVADLHTNTLLWRRDPLVRTTSGHVDMPRLAAAGVALEVFSVATAAPWGMNSFQNRSGLNLLSALAIVQQWPTPTWLSPHKRALYQAERLYDAAGRAGRELQIVTSAEELELCLAARKWERAMAGLLALEGLDLAADDLSVLDELARSGFRMAGLVHYTDNALAGSAHGADKGGLTELGRGAVARLEELGVLVDLAHASAATIEDVLAVATRPVIVSHTGVRGTCIGPSNLDDDQLAGIAASGGLVGIAFTARAVCALDPREVVRAIRYASERIGVEHVALGSDFDGGAAVPFDATGLVQITAALLDDGFTEEEVRLIMGENVLRLLAATLPPT